MVGGSLDQPLDDEYSIRFQLSHLMDIEIKRFDLVLGLGAFFEDSDYADLESVQLWFFSIRSCSYRVLHPHYVLSAGTKHLYLDLAGRRHSMCYKN